MIMGYEWIDRENHGKTLGKPWENGDHSYVNVYKRVHIDIFVSGEDAQNPCHLSEKA